MACDRLVKIHEAASQSLLTSYDDDIGDDSDDETSLLEKSRRFRVDSSKRNFIHSVFSDLNLELPPSTLGRDLGSLVGDSQYADIRFIAEGRSLSAHRFILEARCEYFRVLFNSGLSESLDFQKSSDGNPDNEIPAVVDIVVPDTFVGLLRLLIFLYTDILPDGADGALLEDLMSADRYQVHDLKRLCESMLIPSHDNWIDLLRAATLFNSPQLEVDVLAFLRDNVEVIMKVKDLGLSEEFPGLLAQVMDIRRASYPLPPRSRSGRIHQSCGQRIQRKTGAVPYAVLGHCIRISGGVYISTCDSSRLPWNICPGCQCSYVYGRFVLLLLCHVE